MSMTRRRFLGSSATAVFVAGTMGSGRVFGANERIQVCCMGINGQGSSHMKDVMGHRDDADLVALCDVDARVLRMRGRQVEKETGKKPKLFRDIREALADDSIDAITIATPNHWHALAAVWACQAGKDVYVEKPLSHSLYEGKQVVAAAKKHGRIVQHGTQSRANATLIRDMRLMHEGLIGDIVHSRGYVYKNGNRYAIGHGKPGPAPEHLDWALWQGPSPDHDYLVNVDAERPRGLQVHYNWHWFWLYGNGEIGNQGVHEMDIACWGHHRGLPVKIMSQGGRYAWDDDGETPNTQATSFTYADGSLMTFEVRNLGSFEEAGGGSCGNSFFGSDGYYVRGKGFFDYQNEPIRVEEPPPEGQHKFKHFFNAIRSRKEEDLSVRPSDAKIGCDHIHLANIAYRAGRSLLFDPVKEEFADAQANGMIKREYREGFDPVVPA